MRPPIPTPELDRLIEESKRRLQNMSPEDQQRMYLVQRISYVYGESGWDDQEQPRVRRAKEDVARSVIIQQHGTKTADELLADNTFRKWLDLPLLKR